MSRRLILFLIAGVALAAGDPKAEKDAMAAMDSFRQAFLKKDMAALSNLVSDDLVYGHSDGKTENKTQFLKAIAEGAAHVLFGIADPIVHAQGNAVVLKATVDLRNSTAPDRPNLLSVLHVWSKGSQGWQLVARQSTRLTPPDPPTTK